MKRIATILASVALSLLAFSACNGAEPEEPVAETAKLSVVKSSLAIPGRGGEATIQVKCDGPVVAKTESSWLNVSVNGSNVVASAEENANLLTRYAQVVIQGSGESVTLTVQQYGLRTSGFDPADITVDCNAYKQALEYDFDELIEATCDASWVTLDITPEALKVAIAQDVTEATAYDKQRVATIKWALGIDKGEIVIKQHHANFMQADPNWTVSYLGVQQYNGEAVEEIQNTVAQAGISGKYAITYVYKNTFSQSGLTIESYVENELYPSLLNDINDAIAYYKDYGYDLTVADFLYEDTDFEIFNIFDGGDYLGVAVGIDDNGDATGHFAYAEFTKAAATSSYESWLGEWVSVCGSKTNTWVISEKVKGSTYSISGIDGITNAPVEAEYDSSTNGLIVRAQTELGSYTSSSYGELSLGFYGSYGGSSFYRPGTSPYAIFTATQVDENTASLTGVPFESSDNGTINFEHAKYIGTSSEGKYISIRSNADTTPLPGTITRKGSSGGGDTSAYEKWLGNWTVSSSEGQFSIAISEKEKGNTYNVTGWQLANQTGMSPMTANFNSNGSISFCANSETPFLSNVSLKGSDGSDNENNPFNLHYIGKILYQEKEYYISGSGDIPVCTATLAANGNSANIAGENVEIQDIGTCPFCRLEVLAFSQKNENAVTSLSGRPGLFPLTMSKATSSSVKSNSISSILSDNQGVYVSGFYYEPAMEECTPEMPRSNKSVATGRVIRKFNK